MIGQGRNIVRARAGEEKARRAEREQRRQAEAAALRTEIAGEVHDVVGHALALIAVQAEAARHLATVDAGETDLSDEQRLDQVGGAVETVLVTARGALAETRALTRSLVAAPDDASSTSTALLHPTPGLADLPALVRSAANAGISSSDGLVVTDTIPLKQESDRIKVISVAPLFGEVIRRVYHDESVNSLFK